jgi:hypothetical protein
MKVGCKIDVRRIFFEEVAGVERRDRASFGASSLQGSAGVASL